MSKEKRATEELNVALAGISSVITVAKSVAGKDSAAYDILSEAGAYLDTARDALITIQFYSSKI